LFGSILGRFIQIADINNFRTGTLSMEIFPWCLIILPLAILAILGNQSISSKGSGKSYPI
jgi:hypothetical protein